MSYGETSMAFRQNFIRKQKMKSRKNNFPLKAFNKFSFIAHRFVFLLVFVFIFFIAQVNAQNETGSKILKAEEFINIVKTFHPLVQEANIGVQKAQADITIAKGNFDPTLSFNADRKTFDGKTYYNYNNPELKIPTWYGIEVKAGLESNAGQFLNSEESSGNSSYLGISLPLAKNLLMDKRRAILLQAKNDRLQSEADRNNAINDLLYDAWKAYLDWANAYQQYNVINQTVLLNEVRYRLVRIAFQQGDRPAIDTIEALTQLQNFQFLQNEALVKLNNFTIGLNEFLWLQNNTPYNLANDVQPDLLGASVNNHLPNVDSLLSLANMTHPKLIAYDFKLKNLAIEKKLKFQGLLPTVNLRGNLLSKDYNVFEGVNPGFYDNNYKFGISLGVPLRFSEGRGEFAKAKLKIQETNVELNYLRVQIANKIKMSYNDWQGLQKQITINEAMYKNFTTLFRGENTKFEAGESSLFLLNARENKMLEAQQKLIELKTKFVKTSIALQWSAGQLR
jgi:outer membrane protein TolC